MKFILNEHKKFILEEKFILKEEEVLTEASVADIAVKWTNHFKSTLNNTKEVLNKYIEFAGISKFSQETKTKFTKVKETIKKAAKEIKISLNMPASELATELLSVKAELTDYIKALQAVSIEITDKKSKDTITLLKSKIKELNEFNVKASWQKADVEDLGEILTWVETTIYPLFDTSSIDSKSSTAEIFKTTCTDCLDLIKDIETNLPEGFTDFEESAVESYIYIMKEASENTKLADASKINKGLVIANIDTYLKTVATLKQNYEKINQSSALNISRTKAKEKADAEKAEQERLAKEEEERINPTVDWAKLYEECGNSKNKKEAYNAFWNGGLPLKNEDNPLDLPIAANDKIKKGYYKGEWGAQGELVKSFGKNFTDTLFDSDYGWNETLNPFIALLKYLFKFDIITINDASFYHLVNAFKNRQITEKDLRGKGILGNINLIRNPQFYKLSTSMEEYLEWQKAATNNRNSLADGIDFNTTFANIVSAEGNIDENGVFTDKTVLDNINTSANFPIRNLTEFKNNIKNYLEVDQVEKTTTKATDEVVNKIINSITDKNKAKKFISYWVNVYRVLQADWVEEISKTFKPSLIDIRNSTPTTFNEDREFDKLLSLKTTRYDRDQIKTILTKVVEVINS